MTEAEWLASGNPTAMLEFIGRTAGDRKLRLFACACCRQAWNPFAGGTAAGAVWAAERFADGVADALELRRAHAAAAAVEAPPGYLAHVARAAAAAASAAADHPGMTAEDVPPPPERSAGFAEYAVERRAQTELLRDVIGNPFRPVAVDPRWLTSAVVGLAGRAYAERAFDRLPILADALEEAGCDSADVLAHCRGPGPHVRGCWVVDALLGKS